MKCSMLQLNLYYFRNLRNNRNIVLATGRYVFIVCRLVIFLQDKNLSICIVRANVAIRDPPLVMIMVQKLITFQSSVVTQQGIGQ